MVIELQAQRRHFLQTLSAASVLLAMPSMVAAVNTPHLALNSTSANLLAAWQLPGGGFQAGVLNVDPAQPNLFTVQQAVDLPTRPHGLMHLQGDEYLVIARRPGDWMMRLNIRTGDVSRTWQDADRQLNGHSAVYGKHVYTTETDMLGGSGVLAMRDKITLELLDVWPTHGHDPHEMLVLPNGGLGIAEPFLLVANGGIQTHADMGRTQLNLNQMDSSLVALKPTTGELLKQWVLDDPQLSLRHMALHTDGVVGIAMQAHHGSVSRKNEAPVLALLSEQGLRTAPESAGMKGYAGDIVATPQGFVISCTKSNAALHVSVSGQSLEKFAASSACALAAKADRVWLGHLPASSAAKLELDNHWLLI